MALEKEFTTEKRNKEHAEENFGKTKKIWGAKSKNEVRRGKKADVRKRLKTSRVRLPVFKGRWWAEAW